MTSHRLGTVFAIPVLSAGLLAAFPHGALAQEAQTREVAVTHSCVGVPYPNPNEVLQNPPSWIPARLVAVLRPLIQTTTANASELTDLVSVTAPERVEPGSEFTIRLQSGAMTLDRKASRLHYDFRVPAGATLVDYRVVPGTSQGLSGTPSLSRVNAAGQPSTTGEFLRVSAGDRTVNNRPGWDSTLNNGGGWGEGLGANANRQFRLPAIELTLTAEDGATVTTGLRTGPVTPVAGQDASTGFLTEFNTYSVGAFGVNLQATVGHANYCSATGLGRQPLSTTRVHSVYQTATEIGVQLEALTGDQVRMTAAVSPNPGRGLVRFYDGDTLIGESTVGEEGTAELLWRFRDRGTHPITARYVGDPEYLPSESDQRTVEVTVPGAVVVEPEPEPPVDPAFPEPESGLAGSLAGSLGS